MNDERWIIGEVTGLLRTQPGRDATFTRGGIDAYRVQAVNGTVERLREVTRPPSGWNDRSSAVHLARVAELGRSLQQGGFLRRPPAGPLGDLLQFAPGDLRRSVLEQSRGDARLLQMRISEQYPHPDGGWVARYSAVYAAPLPPLPSPPPPTPAPPPLLPQVTLPPAATAPVAQPPLADGRTGRAGTSGGSASGGGGRLPARPAGGDGCLPSLVPDPFGLGALGGCLAGLGGILIRLLLAAIAVLIGTFVVSGLLWGVLAAPWAESLQGVESLRTRIPPVVGGVLGALIGAALLLLWRQGRGSR